MKLYLAKLMFNIHVDGSEGASEFDEQVRVIVSTNSEDAFYKARAIGKKEEETFVNNNNKLIAWKFIDVAEVYALDELKDGEQLYSCTHKTTDSDSYINYIRQKSMEIQVKNLTFA